MEYHSRLLELQKKINPREVVVGWYSTGEEINYISSLIHNVYKGQVDQPVHLTVDTALNTSKLRVRAYTASEVRVGEKSVIARFETANMELFAHEAEKIGVDALINGHPDDKRLDAPATILSDVENLENSLLKLLNSLQVVTDYVDKVVEGKEQGEAEIGRAIQAALAVVPHIDAESFDKLFNKNIQDLLMIVYLSNLTRTQLAIADKVSTLMG